MKPKPINTVKSESLETTNSLKQLDTLSNKEHLANKNNLIKVNNNISEQPLELLKGLTADGVPKLKQGKKKKKKDNDEVDPETFKKQLEGKVSNLFHFL